jgi:hypothetical protein
MAIYGARSGEDGGGEKCPPGMHRAQLVGMFDVGNQPGFKAGDSPMHKVVLVWELEPRDTKGRAFQMIDSLASYLSAPTAKKKSKFAERIEALLARPLTEDECKMGVDDSLLMGKFCQLFIAPPGPDSKWPKIVQAIGLLGRAPLTGAALLNEADLPKHVEAFLTKARAKAVGGWKPPTPTTPNKSAVAGTQGPSRASEAPDLNIDGTSKNADDIPY